MTLSLIGIAALLLLVFSGVHLGFAALAVGVAGFAYLRGVDPALSMAGQQAGELLTNSNLVIIPIFMLMGELIRRGGIAEELYDFGNALVGRLKGGLAMSTVIACGAFSSICGSSVATAAAMTKVALPPMRRFGYHDSMSAGTVAAGGTLGILIPPSVPMVIYCIFARQDIGKMFMAGVVPGLLMMGLFIVAIMIWVRLKSEHGGQPNEMSMIDRLAAMRRTWAFLVLFGVVLGGIYFGILTPTEAASVGGLGALVFAVSRGRMRSWADWRDTFSSAIGVSAAIFMIGIGAMIFAQFVNLAGLPNDLVVFIEAKDVSTVTIIAFIAVICVLMGMVFDPLSILVLIIPVFLPTLEARDVDLIWFGILTIILIELGLITPPIGINVFTVEAAAPSLKLRDIFRGVSPFVVAMLITALLVCLFPIIATGLPNLMG
ncbi:MAG: TRAP transporter large permease [Sulfitobacter sp.]